MATKKNDIEVVGMRQAKSALNKLASGVGQLNPEPLIQVLFKTLARTAIQKSDRGILCLILDEEETGYRTIKSISDISEGDFTDKNYKLIQIAMENYAPSKIVVRGRGDDSIPTILKELENKNITHLAVPQATENEDILLVSWIKSRVGVQDIVYVSSYANNSDCCAIVELKNSGVYKHGLGEFTAQEYTVAIAGYIAGCPLNRSLTNAILANLEEVEEAEPELGKFVLKNDDGKVRVVYGINSKTTYDDTYKPATRKIKVYEGMNIVKYDIQNTFKNYWCGLYINNYDNKKAFISNVNKVYFKELAPNVLSPDYDNHLEIDEEAQRKFITLDGLDPDDMTDIEIMKYPTGDEMHLIGEVRFSDTLDNLTCIITM